jgi:molecular chaperone DnaK
MSNWRSTVERLFQALCRLPLRLLRTLQRGKQRKESTHNQLARTCETLRRQLATPQHRDELWQTYAQALSLARKCDRQELTQVILKFDPLLGDQPSSIGLALGQALSFLLETQSQTTQNLDAAWRLSQRLDDPASMREIQQQICLRWAQMGDSNLLLAKLLKRLNEASLTPIELSQILDRFLRNHAFQSADPWKAFFEQLKPDELPQIHQVYAVLDRYVEAAKLAEVATDYRSALRYLMLLTGQDSTLRALALANQLGDETAIVQAQQKVAENFWQAGNAAAALEYFQQLGNLERASDCHQRLGELGLAIQCRPTLSPEWIQEIRRALENTVRSQIEQQEFLAAVRSLKSVAEAWREKSQTAEADRTQRLLADAVKTARSAFTTELQAREGHAAIDLFRRWSLLEEEAGNYLEAGLQAEKAQDYFAASVLFEKANAFGQALLALQTASPEEAVDSRKKAQLLEQGGDFFMAALLYEQLGEPNRAIDLYEQAGEFLRAAELRQHQLADEQVVFDRRFQDLLVRAGRVEHLAELCAAKASEPEQSTEQKARLWRRIQDLAEQGLLGQKWLDLVSTELPNVERIDRHRFEQQATAWS